MKTKKNEIVEIDKRKVKLQVSNGIVSVLVYTDKLPGRPLPAWSVLCDFTQVDGYLLGVNACRKLRRDTINELLNNPGDVPEGTYDVDKNTIEDVYNVLDCESIDDKIMKEHPELLKAVVKEFEYDYSGYNEALMDCIKEQAGKLKIDIEKYEL